MDVASGGRSRPVGAEPGGDAGGARHSAADVARAAGVSPTTVSLVLNGRGNQQRVAVATQQRVLEAARRLRYLPDAAARAMVGRRHMTVGLITSRGPGKLHVPVFEEFAVGAIEEAARHGHTLKFLPSPAEGDSYDVFGALRDAQVDGIVVNNEDSVARALVGWPIPFVYVVLGDDRKDVPLDPTVAVVTTDESGGMREAARHLIERGHREVVLLAGDGPQKVPQPKLQAFMDEFEAGIVHYVHCGEWSSRAGYAGMQHVMEEWPEITAVQAGNDWMAIGAMWAAHQAERRIPDDLAIVGFGDFAPSGYLTPPLTTIRWPLRDVGATAVSQLMAQLAGDRRGERTSLPTTLIVRRSTSGPRKHQ